MNYTDEETETVSRLTVGRCRMCDYTPHMEESIFHSSFSDLEKQKSNYGNYMISHDKCFTCDENEDHDETEE